MKTQDIELFAHSTENPSQLDWEPLIDHLSAVGNHSKGIAAIFGAAHWGETAGLLHDLGKAKPEFQAKLRGEKNAEPHSGEGACYAQDRILGIAGKILAYCIAGHHTGLPNGTTFSAARPPTPLSERLKSAKKLDLLQGMTLPLLGEQGIPAPLQSIDPRDSLCNFKLHFFTRMLFSALTDADFLETRRFYDKVENHAPQSVPPALADLVPALEAHLATFAGATGDVNRIRAKILAHVRDGAARKPGLFSLTVPTGGGKTLASLAFAMDHAQRYGLHRVVYVIPYTSIVEQTAEVFRKALGNADAVLEHHASFDQERWDDHSESERLRLKRAAQNWDRPVVVTTAVQFFESLFANRPSKCRKLHRLAKSVIVLDEAQTLPLRLLRPCLAAIGELAEGYGASIVLCTATQPALLKEDGFPHPEGFARAAVRELAPDPPRLYESLRRVAVTHAGQVGDDVLARQLEGRQQALVILNNRLHAHEMFDRIRTLPGAAHLTTSMTARHRRKVLASVKGRLEHGFPVRLIATSLIEAGVDVDFPVVWRAVAGIDSIAQAAGRCNREGRRKQGEIFVFQTDGSHDPPPDLRQFADVGAEVLASHNDPLSLEAVRDYFRRLYWDRDQALDTAQVGKWTGIMAALENSGNQCDFPFADIAAAFRLIEDTTLPLIVRGGDWGVSGELMKELQFNPHAGSIARRLQPFQVPVRQRFRSELLRRSAAEIWREEEFGEQFVLLSNCSLYDAEAGLKHENMEDLGFLQS